MCVSLCVYVFFSVCRGEKKVSAAFDRVSDINLFPKIWKAFPGWGKGRSMGQKAKKRYEVREIFLEDVCICVDAGVWNDLLGDHVGAVFSPQFCLGVKVGPQVSNQIPFGGVCGNPCCRGCKLGYENE